MYKNGQCIGTTIVYHEDGKIKEKIFFENGVDSNWTYLYYNHDGNLSYEVTFKKWGHRKEEVHYYPNGNIKEKRKYFKGYKNYTEGSVIDDGYWKRCDRWFYYDEDGTITKVEEY